MADFLPLHARKQVTADSSAAHSRTASKRSVMSDELGTLSVKRKGKRALPVTASRNNSPRSHSRASCAFKSFGSHQLTVRSQGSAAPSSLCAPCTPQSTKSTTKRHVHLRYAQNRRWIRRVQ